jgi:hypothetical protein
MFLWLLGLRLLLHSIKPLCGQKKFIYPLTSGESRPFCVTDFERRCNEKEETNFVKCVVKIVRGSLVLEVVFRYTLVHHKRARMGSRQR